MNCYLPFASLTKARQTEEPSTRVRRHFAIVCQSLQSNSQCPVLNPMLQNNWNKIDIMSSATEISNQKSSSISMCGVSAPMADRPYFEFSSSSERATKLVVCGAGVGPAKSSHVVSKKVGDRWVPGHALLFRRGGAPLTWTIRYCRIHRRYSH